MTVTAIASEIQKLEPSGKIELFIIDLTSFGGELYRFHAGTNELKSNIIWQGEEYVAFPVQASGFDLTGNGQLPRPKLQVSNVTGAITALVLQYKDILGAKVTRKRTLVKYLDEVNFDGGVNPDADDTAEFAEDVYYIDRKSAENKEFVEFELASAMDLAGVKLPRRQVVQNVCPWLYRGAECGYTGTDYFDSLDNSVVSADDDVCGKRLTSCKLRFGENAELPFGGFPGAGLLQ